MIPFFMERRKSGRLPITDPNMTRFNITLTEGVDMVLWAIENALGGEILVPKIPSYRILDVAHAVGPDCRHDIVGVRPGEKIHEEMITESDSFNTIDLGRYYAILPSADEALRERYLAMPEVKPVAPGFNYSSGSNTDFLTIAQIRELIGEHVDHASAGED